MKTEAACAPDLTASAPSPRLYPKLLGAAWASLDPVVQRVHSAPAETYAEGIAQVSRAPGRLLGCVLDAARVPHQLAARRDAAGEGKHQAPQRVDLFLHLLGHQFEPELFLQILDRHARIGDQAEPGVGADQRLLVEQILYFSL